MVRARQASYADQFTRLSFRQQLILEALHDADADSERRRLSTSRIALAADGPGATPSNFKHDLSKLRKFGLVSTRRGVGGGAWLTAKGWLAVENGAQLTVH